jgi:hypothetical protein
MTKSSVSRIAKRAAKYDAPPFRMPPEGMLSEQVDLVPYGLVLGLIHPEGAPILIAVWNGEGFRYLLPDQATQWADDLVAAGQAVPLAPVIEAIRTLVKRVGEIVTEAILRRETAH